MLILIRYLVALMRFRRQEKKTHKIVVMKKMYTFNSIKMKKMDKTLHKSIKYLRIKMNKDFFTTNKTWCLFLVQSVVKHTSTRTDVECQSSETSHIESPSS